ncbi:MAG: 16S rRNA (uracil(1498)-N(3))-methyltransferase [Rikenellaceae bacterium]
MQLFYCKDICGKIYTLPKEESAHCIRVLRKTVGEKIDIIDGKGGLFEAVIIDDNSSKCVVEVVSQKSGVEALPYELHIAIAPTKNIDRLEWFLEKSTEIGIFEISLLLCDHSERKMVKQDRAEKVVVSAVKQSLKTYVPQLNEMVSFSDFMKRDFGDMPRFIAHCDNAFERTHLKKVVGDRALVLIGPEGDFSPREIETALEKGFVSISLGDSRLRTETAALYATSIISIATVK